LLTYINKAPLRKRYNDFGACLTRCLQVGIWFFRIVYRPVSPRVQTRSIGNYENKSFLGKRLLWYSIRRIFKSWGTPSRDCFKLSHWVIEYTKHTLHF